MKMRRARGLARACLTLSMRIGVIVAAAPVITPAQQQPFITHETRPLILSGPYLLAPTETSATIVWMTDTPCHSKVVYGTGGKLDQAAEPQQHGLIPIGTRHAVTLGGLEPGKTYDYRVVSTRVVKMKSYWPEKGLAAESPTYSFTTFDRNKTGYAFHLVTDTHADLTRIGELFKRIDSAKTDFLVHLGDAFDTENEDVIWSRWLEPVSQALGHRKPLLYARGNHETRGAEARALIDYVPMPDGRFYYVRDHGPAHLIVLDSGEDKADNTNVYARLNAFKAYKEEEFAWLEKHVRSEPRVAEAPFRILLMHAPNFGWTDGQTERWTQLVNKAGVDLAVSGHTHRFAHFAPGEKGNTYHQLVIAPDEIARVEVSEKALSVTVVSAKDGATVTSFVVPARGR